MNEDLEQPSLWPLSMQSKGKEEEKGTSWYASVGPDCNAGVSSAYLWITVIFVSLKMNWTKWCILKWSLVLQEVDTIEPKAC